MTGPLHRAAGNLRRRWRRIFALLVIGVGILAPVLTGVWWSLPLVWFLGLFIVLPILHTLASPLPESDDRSVEDDVDPALDTLREQYARGEIDEETFERRLDRLLRTEDARSAGSEPGSAKGAGGTGNARATEDAGNARAAEDAGTFTHVRGRVKREVDRIREK